MNLGAGERFRRHVLCSGFERETEAHRVPRNLLVRVC